MSVGKRCPAAGGRGSPSTQIVIISGSFIPAMKCPRICRYLGEPPVPWAGPGYAPQIGGLGPGPQTGLWFGGCSLVGRSGYWVARALGCSPTNLSACFLAAALSNAHCGRATSARAFARATYPSDSRSLQPARAAATCRNARKGNAVWVAVDTTVASFAISRARGARPMSSRPAYQAADADAIDGKSDNAIPSKCIVAMA